MKNLSPKKALELLVQGNQRFVKGLRSIEHFVSAKRLKELAENGQSPFAIILTCSDSRLPTEVIFDRGFGDLFVIRVAGNVVAPSVMGSIEFAVSNFGTPLCIIMGHSECGAVKAAVTAETEGKLISHGSVGTIVKKVQPAVRKALSKSLQPVNVARLLEQSTMENVTQSSQLIVEKSQLIAKLIKENKFLVIGALYDLHTGKVVFNFSKKNKVKTKNKLNYRTTFKVVEKKSSTI